MVHAPAAWHPTPPPPTHVFVARQSILQLPASHVAPRSHEPPPSQVTLHEPVAEHATGLLVQLLVPEHVTLHDPASSHVTLRLHEPPPVQATSQENPVHLTMFVAHVFVPAHVTRHAVACVQSTESLHVPSPMHSTAQGMPGGHVTVAALHAPAS
jgi:hypothetical protein